MDGDIKKTMSGLLQSIIKKNVSDETYAWLDSASSSVNENDYKLNISFTALPRKTGKKEMVLEQKDKENIKELLPGFSIQNWTIDRLCRVWLLSQLNCDDKKKYISRIENLFSVAEMNEQVALYSAFPLLAFPGEWKAQCAIGIRSNIDTVLEAIMYFNPYPAAHLEEPAWNQLVLKAFFTGKNVNNIIGLDERSNSELANILFDYVEERWAAHRDVNPQIWRLTGRYIDENHFYMLEKLFEQGSETERQAAALACTESNFEKAKFLFEQHPGYKEAIDKKDLSWEMIENNR